MSAITNVIGSRTPLTVTGLSTLANVTYVASDALDLHAITSGSKAPLDVIFELEVTPGTVSGNKQAILFAIVSMDGTNYSTGPTSGTTTTDEPNLERLGSLPLATNATQQRRSFSLMRDLGFIPYSIKLVPFNDSGAAFSAAAVKYTIITGDAT